jgi:hypothetical protein
MANFLTEVLKPFLKNDKKPELSSQVEPQNIINDLGSDYYHTSGSFFDSTSNYLGKSEQIDNTFRQAEKIKKYRSLATIPDVNDGLDEITNEIIFSLGKEPPVKIDINQDNKQLKEAIEEKFKDILKKMNIRRNFFSIVKKSYIDGQLKIHLGYNEKTRTIDSIKMIDPCMLVYNPETELYRYVQDNSQMFRQQEEITYSREEIVHSDFGLYENGIILSYLEYAIKPANMLKTLEDLLIPMRFSRSISRRVFNVDIGDLPNKRGLEVMNEYQMKFKYKKFYNTETGEVTNQQHITSMVEDYWFANRSGGKGTTVETIDETGNLGELGDILYFYKKLYKSMKIPMSRISMDPDSDGTFNYESTETSKEDLKFFMFISRCRIVYSEALKEILKRECIYSKIIKDEKEWESIEDDIDVYFTNDNTFIDKMNLDNFIKRVEIFTGLQEQQGKLFPVEKVLKDIFKMDDEEIKDNFEAIEKERSNKLYAKFYETQDE